MQKEPAEAGIRGYQPVTPTDDARWGRAPRAALVKAALPSGFGRQVKINRQPGSLAFSAIDVARHHACTALDYSIRVGCRHENQAYQLAAPGQFQKRQQLFLASKRVDISQRKRAAFYHAISSV